MPPTERSSPRPQPGPLSQLRLQAGLTQEELAERAGVSVRGLRKLERGLVERPHRRTLEALTIGLALSEEAGQQLVDFYRGGSRGPLAAAGRRARVVPRQLPAPPPHLVGRSAELDQLDQLTSSAGGSSAAVVVGTAGVGKTALAVWWAHRSADRFPDGQLYVNLRGFAPEAGPTAPIDVVRDFLSALDVRPDQVPDSLDAMVGLYRSILSGRRMLVVLDNARDVGQVRPLLPPAEGSLALVTSRNQLTGLIAEQGAHPVALDVLSPEAAVDLLSLRLANHRVADSPEILSGLSRHCARLPLALVIAAARAASAPSAELDGLLDGPERLDGLSTDDPLTTMRSVFSWSYDALPHQSQSMFRLLALHPGHEISTSAAGSLAGLTPVDAETALRDLSGANMLADHGKGRYSFHDLLRDYAADLVTLQVDGTEQQAAVRRLLDHYLYTAAAASQVLSPHRAPMRLPPLPQNVALAETESDSSAFEWFSAEQAALSSLQSLAVENRFDAHAWQLADLFGSHLDRQGYWHEWVSILRTAIDAALRLGDVRGQALTYRRLGTACVRLGRFEESLQHLRSAISLCETIGEPTEMAEVHGHISFVLESTNRYEEALSHTLQALELLRETDDKAAQSRALNTVGWHHALLGRHDEALDYCEKAMALAKELGHVRTQAAAWDSIGYASYHLGDFDRARDAYDRALAIWRETHARYDEAASLVRLGDLHRAAGDASAARDVWTEALSVFDDLGHADSGPVREKLAQL